MTDIREELLSGEVTQQAPPIIHLRDVRKSFGSLTVLDGLDLKVYPGEVFGFLGRNGAGKSTVIRLLMGITRCDAGHISVFGSRLESNVVKIRQKIGYVAQDQNIYPWMTPRVLSSFVKGFYPRWDKARYKRLIDDFELPEKRRIGTFSGGMKAKLALSLALSTRPELLILDEPTAGMDPVARREFLDLVREVSMTDGATTFFSTHLIDEIEAVADRIAIVDSGRTVYDGTLEPLRNTIHRWTIPISDYVPGDLPFEESSYEFKVLKQFERQNRWELTLQFPTSLVRRPELTSTKAWSYEPMSLEDAFVALVSS